MPTSIYGVGIFYRVVLEGCMKDTTVYKQFQEKDVWLKAEPVVTDTEILAPIQPYHQKGTSVTYKTVMTKEMFIEAYKKWILGETENGTND